MSAVLLGRVLVPDFFNPRPEDVDLGFMFWRMRRIRRFSGHRSALTLDVHHELCGLLADHLGLSRRARVWARCHDLHEFAVGDVVRPVKLALGSTLFEAVSSRWDRAISERLGVELPSEAEWLEVRFVDDMALGIEWTELLSRDLDDIGCPLPEAPENADRLLDLAIANLGQQTWRSEVGPARDDMAFDLAAYSGETRLRLAVAA